MGLESGWVGEGLGGEWEDGRLVIGLCELRGVGQIGDERWWVVDRKMRECVMRVMREDEQTDRGGVVGRGGLVGR